MRGGSRALIGRTADEQPFTQDAAGKSKRRSVDHPPRILLCGSGLAGFGRRLFRPWFDWIDAGLYPMEAEDAGHCAAARTLVAEDRPGEEGRRERMESTRTQSADGPRMTEIRVSDWNELNEQLYGNSFNPNIGRIRSTYAFRGVSSADYRLTTSLSRLGGDFAAMEQHLLRNFRKYARRGDVQTDSVWNWLAVAQHHGLPTRLLDWTFSPQVAMHFATARLREFERDAVIWAVDFVNAHALLPKPLRAEMQSEAADVFTVEMLTRRAPSLEEFDGLDEEPFVLFFEPPSLDDRIVNQFALFSVMSSPEAHLEEWLVSHPELVRRIVIPAELKWEVRDKLDQANVTERVLFPGLDGLSAWLKRYYSPRCPDPVRQGDERISVVQPDVERTP